MNTAHVNDGARQALLRRRSALLTAFRGNHATDERLRAEKDADWVDAASEIELAELAASLAEGERRTLEEVDLALKRLEAGVYGECEGCGEAIEPRRLALIPEARRCADCAAEHEVRR